jgi:hypothetical protein
VHPRSFLAAAALALGAAACTQDAAPLAPRPSAPRLDTRAASASIKDPAFAGLVTNGDWTPAIRAAVASARTIYFPADSYAVSDTITLPAGTRLYGDGTGSLIHQKGGGSIFRATGAPPSFVDSVTIDHLRFRGPSGMFALVATAARWVTVTDNATNGIGLVEVKSAYAYSQITSESQLARYVTVQRNHLTGPYQLGVDQEPIPYGILVEYAADGDISYNVVRNYEVGIQWWGGDASPVVNGASSNPRWVRRFTAQYDTVQDVKDGIWSSMADSVAVSHNLVERCADLCLDAEGSNRMTFSYNTAHDAGNAVTAVFHFSQDVLFENNTISSAGGTGLAGYLFWMHNETQKPDLIGVTVRGNTFTWTGSGVGTLVKEPSRMVVFEKNIITDAVLDLDLDVIQNNEGGVRVIQNRIALDRSTGGRPAIKLGHNFGDNLAVHYDVEVRGNHVLTTVSQDTARGIFVYAAGYAVDSTVRVTSDTIRGFGRWLKIHADAGAPAFTVTNNRYEGVTNGAIETDGTVTFADQSGNSALPAFSASIIGPTTVPRFSTIIWSANPASGAAPYAYQWYVNNVLQPGATLDDFEYTAGTSAFTLKLVVTDALGATVTATKSVTICASCFQ